MSWRCGCDGRRCRSLDGWRGHNRRRRSHRGGRRRSTLADLDDVVIGEIDDLVLHLVELQRGRRRRGGRPVFGRCVPGLVAPLQHARQETF